MHNYLFLLLFCFFALAYSGDLDQQFYLKTYEKYSMAPPELKQLKHAFLVEQLQKIAAESPAVRLDSLGTSVEQRTIYSLTFGYGPTRILLWSQMHGDESTATAALLAVFNYLALNPDNRLVKNISEKLTVKAIPMLNPDGAEINNRYNTWDIDINRDANYLSTPEARILKQMRDSFKPDFGFNLHDMMGREMVDDNKKALYLAFMAPPFNKEDEDNAVRLRAKKLVVYLQKYLQPLIPDHTARYKADYMPRAFGDAMQSWGVSTILIEAGLNDTDDPHFLEKLNFLTLLQAFAAIASNDLDRADPALYEQIPLEGMPLFDLVIQNALIYNGLTVPPFRADIGINIENVQADGQDLSAGIIVDLGDLSVTSGLKIISGKELVVIPGRIVKIRERLDQSVLIKNGVTIAVIKSTETITNPNSYYFPVNIYPDSSVQEFTGERVFTTENIPIFTSIPSAALDLKNEGQIKRGRQADLLIFEGMSDKQLDLSRLVYVIKNGVVIKVP